MKQILFISIMILLAIPIQVHALTNLGHEIWFQKIYDWESNSLISIKEADNAINYIIQNTIGDSYIENYLGQKIALKDRIGDALKTEKIDANKLQEYDSFVTKFDGTINTTDSQMVLKAKDVIHKIKEQIFFLFKNGDT